jgi:two-component system response regulator YesN
MKVLIVDDEEHVREGIELAISWDKFGVSEIIAAENGGEALELIRLHHPAVMFCDMNMPGMEGTELLRKLREDGFDTQVIVVSGHDKYEYTRATVQANGIDYLLKPFRKAELEQALVKAAAIWKGKENNASMERETGYRLRRADALIDEQKLASYIKGDISFHEGIRGLILKLGVSADHMRVALFLPGNRLDLIAQRFLGDAELFLFAVNNIAHDAFRMYGSHVLCRLDDYQWMLIADLKEKVQSDNDFLYLLKKVAANWRNTLGLNVFIGQNHRAISAGQLPSAYAEAKASLLNCDILRQNSGKDPIPDVPRFAEQELLLQAALDSGNKPYAAQVVQAFTGKIRDRGSMSLKELQGYTLEANLFINRMGDMMKLSQAIADVPISMWISDLQEWEQTIIQKLWDLIEKNDSGACGVRGIQAIREYIHRHYSEDLSLADLSGMFHFSPQYIAKKFKELYDTTVINYLTEVRMEKAQSLLIHTSMNVSEISRLVGYADENYFGKVFRKQFCVSPTQYRHEHQD